MTSEPTELEYLEAITSARLSINRAMSALLEICQISIEVYREEATRFLVEEKEQSLATSMLALQTILSCIREDRPGPKLTVVK